MSVGPSVQAQKLEEAVCCAVVPRSVVKLCVDRGGCTVVPSVALMPCGSAKEFHQFKDMLLKNIPCVHLVPTRAEFSCHSHDEKFLHCVRVPRFDEVGRCVLIGRIDVVGEC